MKKLFLLLLCLTAKAGLPPVKSTGENYITTQAPSTVVANPVNLSTSNVTGLLPVANGGFGLSGAFTSIASGGTQNNVAVPTHHLVWTGASTTTLTGLVAQTDGTEVTITNKSSGALTLSHASVSSTAANRFELPGSASVTVGAGQSVKVTYYGTSSRWTLATQSLSVTSPLVLTGSTLSAPTAITGSGVVGEVPQWSSSTALTSASDFSFNNTTKQLGVQYSSSTSTVPLDVKSDVAQTISPVSSASLSSDVFTFPTELSTYTVTETTAYLPVPAAGGTSSTINYSGSGYTANGQTIYYRIRPGYDTGSITWGAGYSVVVNGGADDNSSNPYSVDVAWPATAGVNTPNVWVVERSFDGSTFDDYQQVATNSLSDDNSAWSGGGPPTYTPIFDDIVSAAQAYTYDGYVYKTTPVSSKCYSAIAVSPSFTDTANDGHTYRLLHSFSGGSGDFIKSIKGGANSNEIVFGSGTSFTEDTTTFSGGDNVATPTTYGVQATGSTGFTATVYNYDSTLGIYSSSGTNAGTFNDPSDSQYYYHTISWSGGTGTAKTILDNPAVGNTDAASPSIYDGITGFAESTTVTPTSAYLGAARFAARGTTTAARPVLALKSLDGSYARLDFKNSSDVTIGTIQQNSTELRMKAQAPDTVAGYIALGASSVTLGTNSAGVATLDASSFTVNGVNFVLADAFNMSFGSGSGTRIGTSTSTKLGLWNATPIIQPVNTVAINDVLVNTGLRAAGGTSNFSTTLTLRTGGTAVGSGPLKFTSASLLTTPVAGTEEFLTDKRYTTITTGTARKEYTLNDGTLTLGSIPFATTNGRLLDDNSNLFWDDSNNRLGIGTNAPSHPLHVLKSDSTDPVTLMVQNTAGSASGDAQIVLGTRNIVGDQNVGAKIKADRTDTGSAGTTDLQLSVSTGTTMTERMRILGSGDIGIGTSTPGAKLEVDGTMKVKAGTSTSKADVGGTLSSNQTDVGNVGTGEDDLVSYSIPANTLSSNGYAIDADYHGVFVNSTSTKRLRFYLDGTSIFDSGALTISSSSYWAAHVRCQRSSATAARCVVTLNTTGASTSAYATAIDVTVADWTSARVLKNTGETAGVGTADNDIVNRVAKIRWEP